MSKSSECDSLLSKFERYVLLFIQIRSSNQQKAKVRYCELLKYAPTFEIIIFGVGIFCSAFVGVSFAVTFIFYSDIVADFVSPVMGSFRTAVMKLAVWGLVKFVMAFIQMFCLQYCARRQARHIRQLLFSVSPAT